jgi:tRNA threonylcarbamoyladenosine biosynthesis protein TsaE
MQIVITNSEQETEALGARFAEKLPGGTVVAMYGDLGAGKTAFVRGMARGMGLNCRVSSPTFPIVNEYLGDRDLIHFDMYRLSGADELFEIGWEDYLEEGAVAVVEWPERAGSLIPPDALHIEFRHAEGDESRSVRLNGGKFGIMGGVNEA